MKGQPVELLGPTLELLCLNVSPKDSYIQILTLNVMGLEGGAFGMCSGHEGAVLMNGIHALLKEAPQSLFIPSIM